MLGVITAWPGPMRVPSSASLCRGYFREIYPRKSRRMYARVSGVHTSRYAVSGIPPATVW